MEMVYLDNNATTRPAPEVVEAMQEMLRDRWGNPSSVHRFGQGARQRLELARSAVAGLLGCSERELVFTSGGTESANLAIRGSLDAAPGRTALVTTRVEHSAVRELAEHLERDGREVIRLDLDARGAVDLDGLARVLDEAGDRIAVVSVMWINNETGAVQPLPEIAAMCRARGVRVHTDAVQIVGKRPIDVAQLPIDLLTCSAHKLHGPKGAGALYVRRGVRLAPQHVGGPQERERRGGTENVAGIVGFGVAADLAQAWLETDERERLAERRDRFETSILAACPDSAVNGAGGERIWNTANIAFPRLEAEAILLLLSERGLCASAGAACSSGSLEPSPVLLAMGVPETLAHGSVRFSLSRETTDDEIDRAIELVTAAVARLRKSFAVA